MKSMSNAADLFLVTVWLIELKNFTKITAKHQPPDIRPTYEEKAEKIQSFLDQHVENHNLRPLKELPDLFNVEMWLVELKVYYESVVANQRKEEQPFTLQKIASIQSFLDERLQS